MSHEDADDERWMAIALEEAELAAAAGDVPVGAVIVLDGVLLARGRNRREVHGDPTAHAEVEALREAARVLGHWRVAGNLYATLEPCAMCAGALVNARVSRLIYGADDAKAGAVHSRYGIGVDQALNHTFAVSSGVLAERAREQLQTFFRKLRAEGQK